MLLSVSAKRELIFSGENLGILQKMAWLLLGGFEFLFIENPEYLI